MYPNVEVVLDLGNRGWTYGYSGQETERFWSCLHQSIFYILALLLKGRYFANPQFSGLSCNQARQRRIIHKILHYIHLESFWGDSKLAMFDCRRVWGYSHSVRYLHVSSHPGIKFNLLSRSMSVWSKQVTLADIFGQFEGVLWGYNEDFTNLVFTNKRGAIRGISRDVAGMPRDYSFPRLVKF